VGDQLLHDLRVIGRTRNQKPRHRRARRARAAAAHSAPAQPRSLRAESDLWLMNGSRMSGERAQRAANSTRTRRAPASRSSRTRRECEKRTDVMSGVSSTKTEFRFAPASTRRQIVPTEPARDAHVRTCHSVCFRIVLNSVRLAVTGEGLFEKATRSEVMLRKRPRSIVEHSTAVRTANREIREVAQNTELRS
jgi:hypothetical protein